MNLSVEDKVQALRALTAGAPDVFACHSQDEAEGEAHWRPVYHPVSDTVLQLHLAGHVELGSYPLIPTNGLPACRWICADFDGKRPMTNWKSDVQRLVPFLMEFDGCPVFVNLSRSAAGAHVRMLFREPVPAWMARRWLNSWLKEAGIIQDDDWDAETPSSFDRLIPPQDVLKSGFKRDGNRYPGNLAGSPLHGRRARQTGGTLPLDPARVARGDFTPDGRHWEHVLRALDARSWGESELRAALSDAPETLSTEPPMRQRWVHDPDGHGEVPQVPQGNPRSLDLMLHWCRFIEHMRQPGRQDYHLWMALASQLHRFGSEGKEAFHALSKADPRYNPTETEQKWHETADMAPVRCDTLVRLGWTCPHLGTPRCGAARSPAYFGDYAHAEVL